MITHEIALISQLWNGCYNNKSIRIQCGSGKFEEWITKMRSLLTEIEYGLGVPNRKADTSFYRCEVAGILLNSSLHWYDVILPTTSILEEQYQHCLDSMPQLSLSDCFYVAYHLGLVPEIIEYLLKMQHEVRNFILHEVVHWINGLLQKKEMVFKWTLIDSFVLSTSLFICMRVLMKNENNIEILFKSLKNIFNVILALIPSNSEIKLTACSTRMMMMLRKLHSMKEDFQNVSQPMTALSDVLHLNSVSSILTSISIESVGTDCTEKDDAVLVRKLMLAHNDSFPKASPVLVHGNYVNDCIVSALQSTKLIHNEVVFDLSHILSFLKSENQRLVRPVSGHDLEKTDTVRYTCHLLHTIDHCLHNFEVSLLELLNQMIMNPFDNNFWKDAFECLKRNPECLANTETLLLVLKGISQCLKKGDSKCANDSIFVAIRFQKAFWSGFRLLCKSSKMKVTKLMICDEDLYRLISEYPLKKFEKNLSRLQCYYQNRDIKVKSFFDSIVNENSASDSFFKEACEICISHPEGMLQKLVDQATKNAPQIEIIIEIFCRLSCLLEIKNVKSKSLLWTYFHKVLTTCCQNNDSACAENGINFFKNLVLKVIDKHCSQEISETFVRKVFEDVAICLTSNQVNYFQMRKMQLKILDSIINLDVFFQAVSVTELVVLCVGLGANIDRSRHFWNSNPDFDHDEHETLVEFFEQLTKITVETLRTKECAIQEQFSLWVAHSITCVAWTTQLRFLPITSLNDQCKVQIPSSLSEVCSIPDTLETSKDVSYGPGTGLLAWHQCFVVNPSICPLSSLDIHNLSPDEVKLFSDGWILTLAQVLPFCLQHEWSRLLEASKVLLIESSLHAPAIARYVTSLPGVDLSDCSIVLGLAWILVRVSELLAKECFIDWTSPRMWLHFSKCYCMFISKLINNSAEFGRAISDSQLFMLSQVFCCVCGFIRLLSELPLNKKHSNTEENVFILTLELVGSFEKLYQKVKDKYLHTNTKEEVSEIFVDDSSSDDSSLFEMPDCSHVQLTLDISERLNEMMQAASFIPIKEYSDSLKQKLSSVLKPPEG